MPQPTLGLDANMNEHESGQSLTELSRLTAAYHSFLGGHFMAPNAQHGPICSKPVESFARYPRYVCHECASKASSQDGRVLEFYNISFSGGFAAKYADTGEPYLSHDCFINGVKCFADEARFGGIVIEIVADYKTDLTLRYWEYQKYQFPNWQKFFERPFVGDKRPPVFVTSEAWRNIIINPAASQPEKEKLISLVNGERHKWFGSMNSSQALALSIFGNLFINDSMLYLNEIKDDEGQDLFGKAKISSNNFEMEHKIHYLGEPRPTSIDGFFSGDYQIAIECKFTEEEFGSCSRPRLKLPASNYSSAYCDGSYSIQRERKERCSLTEIGVHYWCYVPSLFKWKNDCDLSPCPLYKNYQLVRNILAAGVKPDGTVSVDNGHAVLIYDARNPAFQKGGDALITFTETLNALQEPTMLRKCGWQRIIQPIREKAILPWLTEHLALKYGL